MVYSLEDQVDKQHQTIELLQQNENSLREYIKEKHNQGKQETEGFFISNEVFVKYPVIRSMINKVLYKTIDESYVKFCSMIQMSSCKTYKRLIDFLPLISLSSCSNYIRPMKHSLKKMLENVQEIPGLIYKVYHEYVPFDAENKVANELFITLGGDAACLKNHPNSAAIYVYKMLPLAKSIPPHAIHIMRTTNGSSPPSVVNKFDIIANCLSNLNIKVKFISTDGDVSFDDKHANFYDNKVHPISNLTFDQIVERLKNELKIPISDPFHLIKSARSRLMDHLLLIDPEKLICVNTALFSQAVELGPAFTDRSKYGAMKDTYPLALYSWYSFSKVMQKGRFDAAYYVMPFVFFIEAFRSNLLSRKTRLAFLNEAYILFNSHLQNVHNVERDSVFKQRFSCNSLGVLFADEIFLKRIINTIIGLAIAIKYHYDDLALQRIGTHDIELFFGLIRKLSCFDNSYDNAVRIACEAIIVKQFATELGSSNFIEKRENEAGVVLTENINSLDDINFDFPLLNNVVYNLMKGNEVEEDKLSDVEKMLDYYTHLIINSKNYKIVRIPNLCTGTLPLHRYNVMNYSLSVLPIPKVNSTFHFYMSDKKFKQKVKRVSILQWCIRLCASINGIEYNSKKKVKIPFEYDLNNLNDIEKIVDFLTHPYENMIDDKKLRDFIVKEEEKNKNIIFGIDVLDENRPDDINSFEDEQFEYIIQNLNDKKKFQKIISSSDDPKKILKKVVKRSFINTLKKAMSVFLQVLNQMNKDEFMSKFKTNFSQGLISPYKTKNVDQEIQDSHQEAITNYVLEDKDPFLWVK